MMRTGEPPRRKIKAIDRQKSSAESQRIMSAARTRGLATKTFYPEDFRLE
jgi:hypothetical protein